MSENKKPFSDPRWTQLIGGRSIGKVIFTEEELEESRKILEECIEREEKRRAEREAKRKAENGMQPE